ncbi:hypothetical protein BC830DRAFT_1077599 [Chytriomyces sp. MP71]|nr:hypothetical protein BC830DRAFT_1077599 [Chytriomyces sp. MP71]
MSSALHSILSEAQFVDASLQPVRVDFVGKSVVVLFDAPGFCDDEFSCCSVAPHLARGDKMVLWDSAAAAPVFVCVECFESGIAVAAKSGDVDFKRIPQFDKVSESEKVVAGLRRATEKYRNNSPFAVIMVSFAEDEALFNLHAAHVSWPTLDFNDHATALALADLCGAFVGETEAYVWDASGSLINKHGNATFKADMSYPFLPLEVTELSESNMSNNYRIDEKPALVVFCESTDSTEQARIHTLLNKVAHATLTSHNSNPPLLFFTSTHLNESSHNLRNWAQLPSETHPDFLIIDSTRNNEIYLSEGRSLTEESLTLFVRDFLVGALKSDKALVPRGLVEHIDAEKLWIKTVTVTTVKTSKGSTTTTRTKYKRV